MNGFPIEDALQLYRSNDLNALGIMASARARAEKRQRRDLHSQSLHQLFQHLRPSCQFCAFAAKKRDATCF